MIKKFFLPVISCIFIVYTVYFDFTFSIEKSLVMLNMFLSGIIVSLIGIDIFFDRFFDEKFRSAFSQKIFDDIAKHAKHEEQ